MQTRCSPWAFEAGGSPLETFFRGVARTGSLIRRAYHALVVYARILVLKPSLLLLGEVANFGGELG